ncbi:MAG: sugar transferase [Actinomycetia bacterium]|nr:sugar transferase [Actinomycetes bacterium]
MSDSAIRRWLRVQDMLLIGISAFVALVLTSRVRLPHLPADLTDSVTVGAGLVLVTWWALLYANGCYCHRTWGYGVDEYRRILSASFQTFALLAAVMYLTNYTLPRTFVVVLFIGGTMSLLLGRRLLRTVVNRFRSQGIGSKRVLLAGSPLAVEQLSSVLERERWLGLQSVGVLQLTGPEGSGYVIDGLHEPCDIVRAVETVDADAVIFCDGSFAGGTDFNLLARQLERHDVQTIVVPALTDISAQRMMLRPVAGLPLVHVEKPKAEQALKATKRAFDVVVGALSLLAALPILVLTAIAIKLEDGGPIFFRQQRVGTGGEHFTMFKLRSMVLNAEHIRAEMLEDENESDGILFKIKHDPRITRVGGFIRRFSIDELPQLWNVLRGDMSVVGPRPALPAETAAYADHVRRRLDVRPGLTGLWQVSGRSDLPWDETVRLDLYYVDNWSMLQDVNILLRTAKAVVRASGAY